MKRLFTVLITLLIVILFFPSTLSAQNNESLWLKISKQKANQGTVIKGKSEPRNANFYQLNLNQLKARLKNAPLRGASNKQSDIIIKFPTAIGDLEAFRVMEAPVMAPELQAKHPDIKSYVGQSIENPASIIRFSVTPLGLHTMTLSSKHGTQYIDPFTKNSNNYIVYSKHDLPKIDDDFVCGVTEEIDYSNRTASEAKLFNANDGMLRTYRLALACTAEYGNYHGGDVNLIKAAMAVTMTRVSGIFERDLSITMTMVENTNIIYFGDVNNDPYTNDNGSTMLGENQDEIDTNIGENNYDIGHVFSTGGGGIAGLGVVCVWASNPPQAKRKARGVTGSGAPAGDAFDVDYVAHEMGHQFGANHTFNSAAGNCGGGNRNASTAYEPGSGSTIMAYAGICSPDNIQQNSNDYFHQVSLQEIWAHVNGAGACAVQTSTGNSAPTANTGGNYTIPISTPYKLMGSSTDAEGTGTHTYTWEEYDLTTNTSLPSETSMEGPIVRSFNGTTSPIRYIPRLADLRYSNGSTAWEKLSSVSRAVNFQLTVRDNDSRGGQTATDGVTINVIDTAGPFLVTSQSTSGLSWTQNASEEITWDTANTDTVLGVSMVNILLSTDGGLTYPINLTPGGTANDGAEIITVPNILAPYCRVMVEAIGNIFFAINTADFAIGYSVNTVCNQYSESPNFAIPDNGTSLSLFNINVPQSGTISDINIGVNITHTFIGDLQVSVLSPSSTQVNLFTPGACGNVDNLIVKFDDNSGAFACSLAPNNLVMQTPNGTLSDWNGEESSGNWTLGVVDTAPDDTGTLNSWYVEICETTITLLSTDDFELTNFSLFPNPNKGEFTVKLNSVSNNLQIEVIDMRGRSLFNNSYKNTTHLTETINLKNAQSGMYLVKVSDGNKSGVKKIVIN